MKLLFIILGSLCIGIGVVGIFVPGLPTTPFLLLGAACYLRGSARLYEKLQHSPVIGKHIRYFNEKQGMTKPVKIGSLILMWGMICLSIFLFRTWVAAAILIAAGGVGTMVMGFFVKTIRE